MVSVKSTPEITDCVQSVKWTARIQPTTFPAMCTLDARARRRHSGRHLPVAAARWARRCNRTMSAGELRR
eukprot:1583036-Prymnesium_polylepis.1